MGKKHKKKKRLARLRADQGKSVQENTGTAPHVAPSSNYNDGRPHSEVASDIKKISLVMTGLTAVVVVVAILNSQTKYVHIAGKTIMRWLGVE